MNTGLIFFRTSRYLRYLFLSQNKYGHGIHSPFVFDLVTRVFGNKANSSVVDGIEKIRKKLKKDKRKIEILDLGAGSEMNNGRLRKISDIAAHSAVPEKYGILLSNLATEFGKRLVVEFGTSFGISTMYIAASCRETQVLTMEGSSSIADIAEMNFSEAGLSNIIIYKGPFDETLKVITAQGVKPGLVFIDGNHRKKPLLHYFEKIAEISDSDTVIVIDDIYYSMETEEAWKEIKASDKISLTIDLFRMGLVFFRKGIARSNYIISY